MPQFHRKVPESDQFAATAAELFSTINLEKETLKCKNVRID